MSRDPTLGQVLASSEQADLFREFLDTRKCAHLLHFWRHCEKFRAEFSWRASANQASAAADSDPSSEASPPPPPPASNNQKARDIYDLYLTADSPLRLSVDPDIVDRVRRAVIDGAETVPIGLFDRAQHFVYRQLEQLIFPSYLTSELCIQYRGKQAMNALRAAAIAESEGRPTFELRSSSESNESPKRGGAGGLFGRFIGGKSGSPTKGLSSATKGLNSATKRLFRSPFRRNKDQSAHEAEHADFPQIQAPTLLDEELNPVKEFIDQCVSKLIAAKTTGGADAAAAAEAAPVLTDEECDLLHKYFNTDAGRRHFAESLNLRRSGQPLTEGAFEVLWRLVKVALIQSDIFNDYATAKMLMHMANTYYRSVDGVHDYVQSRISSIEIWKKPRFWEYAFYDSVAAERAKLELMKDWKDLSEEEQEEYESRERSIFFGQLGSFGMHMLSLGVSLDEVQHFVYKQCMVNGLGESECSMLIANLYALDMQLREQERVRSKKISDEQVRNGEKEEWRKSSSDYQSHRTSELISEEHGRCHKYLSVLTKRGDALGGFVDICETMRRREARKMELERERVLREFQQLRELLDQKQAEALAVLEARRREVTARIESRAAEITRLKEETAASVGRVQELLAVDDSAELEQGVRQLESSLDGLLTLPKEYALTNQFITLNYASSFSLREQTERVERIAVDRQEKLSVASWIIRDFSRIQRDIRCERENSPVFRHYGFNWRLTVFPHGQPPYYADFLGLSIELIDAPNAVGWSVHTRMSLRLANQKFEGVFYPSSEVDRQIYVFNAACPKSTFADFMPLAAFKEPDAGWLLDDSVVFELEIASLEVAQDIPSGTALELGDDERTATMLTLMSL